MTPLPFVSVIVPHLNDHDRLATCLAALARQSYPSGCFEVIVVDNGSQRPITEVVAGFPFARETFEPERGCGTARNRGVSICRGEYVAFTDSDCVPDPEWLANGIARLRAGADIVGGEIKVFCADEACPTDWELYDKVFGFEQARYVRWKRFTAGANIMTSRAAFERIGPFRNGELPEDLEWGRRAVALGLSLAFVPDALIRHPARRTWAEVRKKIDRTMYHSRNMLRENGRLKLRWALLTLALAAPPVLKMVKILTFPDITRVSFKLRAIKVLIKARYYRVGQMAGCLVDPEAIGRERFET